MEATKNSLLQYVWHVSTTIFELHIEAGMATSFNYSIKCDFHRNQADFHDINDYSKGSDDNSFQYIY